MTANMLVNCAPSSAITGRCGGGGRTLRPDALRRTPASASLSPRHELPSAWRASLASREVRRAVGVPERIGRRVLVTAMLTPQCELLARRSTRVERPARSDPPKGDLAG